jgi:hypothetical protein
MFVDSLPMRKRQESVRVHNLRLGMAGGRACTRLLPDQLERHPISQARMP